jgi:glyoxylase I family protein
MALELRGVRALLQVFDMPTSIRFYRDVLGFAVAQTSHPVDQYGWWVLLRREGTELMLNAAYEEPERPPVPDAARTAAHRDTGLFFECPDVEAAYRHLRAHGLAVAEPVVQSYGMKQVYVRDPDGYVLCFQWPA